MEKPNVEDKMCSAHTKKNKKMRVKKEASDAPPARPDSPPIDYSYIFNNSDTESYMHRAMMMQRLVQDPFYKAMNVSVAARMWMLRHLASMAGHMKRDLHVNLLQFFLHAGHAATERFLKYKNAPHEMIALWRELCEGKPVPEASSHHGRKPRPSKKKQH